MNKLCEYAQDKSIGVCINVICSKTNEFCPMIRYCTLEQCPVMTAQYNRYGCKLKNNLGEDMSKKKSKSSSPKKEQEIIFDTSEIRNEIICDVNFSKNGKSSLRYKYNTEYYNITIDGTFYGKVKITYRADFKKENIISITQL